ncbi:uncharacterized protein BKCO1_4000073 [Diplodia corticola]|uniref:Secreted protein n=1 Tax=Diplodia corticola TaxID=236234 RepID=A0A1J9QTD1_9PEZI|nr:uncharacterized protein BKCO1_4000073 [Diplodia corticola]OJD32230.1 secreted protein [Diplodia corticola]
MLEQAKMPAFTPSSGSGDDAPSMGGPSGTYTPLAALFPFPTLLGIVRPPLRALQNQKSSTDPSSATGTSAPPNHPLTHPPLKHPHLTHSLTHHPLPTPTRLPDASIPPSTLQSDIAALSTLGAGGLELLGYYQYGLVAAQTGGVAAPPTDWTIYGFGTPSFAALFRAALEQVRAEGLLLDFAQGANQGQGVPSVPGERGLAVELAYANVSVDVVRAGGGGGGRWEGVLPESVQPVNAFGAFMHGAEEFGAQVLRAVLAVEVVAAQNVSTDSGDLTFSENTVGRVVDLTGEVDPVLRELNWTAPEGESEWRLMAWYERYTNQRSCAGGVNATDYIGNGSWTVDHFSAAGSKKLTDFFDAHVIPDAETRELLASVGKYGWEDSMEMFSALLWTPELPSMFNQSRGYDITLCLPYLITPANYWNSEALPYGEGFVDENTTFGDKCNEDYRTTLNEGYQEYLAVYVNWSHGLGVEYSAQPAYNLPLNMLDDIPILDAPEGESLGFNNIIDTYRQFSGPAHLSGISVISSECGALSGAPYQQTFNDLLWSVRRGLATGISMHVLHGFAYSGPYTNTTWPSYTTFAYQFSEMWNQHQPSWIHMNDTIRYIARNQYVSQAGTPSVDLAFYLYEAPWAVSAQYMDTNLEELGYTYEYLSANNLLSPEAFVEDNILAPTKQSFKALIFSNASAITPGGAAKVQEFSEAGLPVFFVGATNFTSIGQEPGAAAEVASTISSVVNSGLENVHTVTSSADLPDALSQAGILPKVSFSTPTSWYPFWRRADGIDYAYIYNDGLASQTVDVTFATTGTPYFFDAWTGAITPVLQYTTSPSSPSITIPITLASNQTTILGFAHANSSTTADPLPAAPDTHITSATGALAGLVPSSPSPNSTTSTTITAYLTGPASLTLSTGQTLNLTTAPPPPATTLSSGWSITIEDWHRTSDPYSMDTAITTHTLANATLAPWSALGLPAASGIGRYTTSFATLPGANAALLSLGPVAHSMRAWLNGVALPPLDVADARADLTGLLLLPPLPLPAKKQEGAGEANELVVEVTTTLFNRVKADGNATWSVGATANELNGAFYETHAVKEYGLLGPVVVEWVAVAEVGAGVVG